MGLEFCDLGTDRSPETTLILADLQSGKSWKHPLFCYNASELSVSFFPH